MDPCHVLSQEIWRKFPPLKDSFTSREQYANWHNLRKDLTAMPAP